MEKRKGVYDYNADESKRRPGRSRGLGNWNPIPLVGDNHQEEGVEFHGRRMYNSVQGFGVRQS
jgi:hypothetical protein